MVKKVLIADKGANQWQGIPSIERAANGRLWCTYFTGGPKEPDIENRIILTTSDDDGDTWCEPYTVQEREGNTRLFDSSLWHDPNGKLWLFFCQANLEEKEFSIWYITCENSDSADPHWSDPVRLEFDVTYCFRSTKPTVLSTGAWVLPIYFTNDMPEIWLHKEAWQAVGITGDQGKTWSFHGEVYAGPQWALENMILERTDGSLLMLMRTDGGVLWQSSSTDGGRTWSDASASQIDNPGSRFFIRRLASGRVLLICNPHTKDSENEWHRERMCAFVSDKDDGTGFYGELEIDVREKVSYPDAVQGPDGTIYMVYDYDRYGPGEIRFCSFREEDILS
jgi:predicted neuraminidase